MTDGGFAQDQGQYATWTSSYAPHSVMKPISYKAVRSSTTSETGVSGFLSCIYLTCAFLSAPFHSPREPRVPSSTTAPLGESPAA